MTVTPDLSRQARLWRDSDPDPATRAELDRLLRAGDGAALAACFHPPLAFGTAGLRGLRGSGPGRMNRLLVRRVTAVVAEVLQGEVPGAAARGVVVGFDARHGAREMALDAAMVLAGAGICVHLIPDYAPTPLAAFAALELGTAAAIVLTASHNPPAYSGYKLYWEDGAQIVPPVDAEIAAALERLPLDTDLPVRTPAEARAAGRWTEHGEALRAAYLDAIRRPTGAAPRSTRDDAPARPPRSAPGGGVGPPRPDHAAAGTRPGSAALRPGAAGTSLPGAEALSQPLKVVYTALHGVAGSLALRALEAGGPIDIAVVEAQMAPDGDFPTVAVPNPEETGALEPALAQAREAGADLVLANDPDGDRLAVAVADGAGGFAVLSGDQIGCLLADHLLRGTDDATRARGFVINTVVSSALLGRIAAHHGVGFEQTLTGFKWIWHRALAREAAGETYLFGYEDAIGFGVSRRVRDKDGIAAAVVFCELARTCRAENMGVAERLDALYQVHGLSCTRQISLSLAGGDASQRLGERLQAFRAAPPGALAGHTVRGVHDYLAGRRVATDGRAHEPIDLPPANLLQLDLDCGLRASIRPSGTEPRLKIYLERLGEPGIRDLDTARTEADRTLGALAEDLLARLA